MAYHPGELRYRVTIKRVTRTQNRTGGQDVSVSDLAEVWAHVRPKSGKETTDADRVNGVSMYLFVIRWRSDLREDDRIEWNGVDYNIRAINDRGRRELYLEIDAERGVAQ